VTSDASESDIEHEEGATCQVCGETDIDDVLAHKCPADARPWQDDEPVTDGGQPESDIDRAERNVANARALLSDFDEVSLEVKHGSIDHAIEELQNARRALPDDF
jgi:5-methylcytosine-specific restriction endonuclease McrA